MKCFLAGTGGVVTLAEGNYALSELVKACDTIQKDAYMLQCPSSRKKPQLDSTVL